MSKTETLEELRLKFKKEIDDTKYTTREKKDQMKEEIKKSVEEMTLIQCNFLNQNEISRKFIWICFNRLYTSLDDFKINYEKEDIENYRIILERNKYDDKLTGIDDVLEEEKDIGEEKDVISLINNIDRKINDNCIENYFKNRENRKNFVEYIKRKKYKNNYE